LTRPANSWKQNTRAAALHVVYFKRRTSVSYLKRIRSYARFRKLDSFWRGIVTGDPGHYAQRWAVKRSRNEAAHEVHRWNSRSLIAVITFFALSTMAWALPAEDSAKDDSDIAKRLQASANVLQEIMSAPDNGIPEEILNDAKCIVVVPSMVKFAIGIGGHYGKGVATCRTSNG
jgi:hypothetical protein